jgi:transposase
VGASTASVHYRVIVTRRPKYACRSCSNGVVKAPAPARLIAGGMPTAEAEEAFYANLNSLDMVA